MLSKSEETKISKFLSLILRHQPEKIGLKLDENGWINTEELITQSIKHNFDIDFEKILFVVQNNKKQRFTFNEDYSKIRANQGHSLDIDLELTPQTPPDILFHGTAIKNLDSIKEKGILKQERLYVHLSSNYDDALKVGARYGKPIVLKVDAKHMVSKSYLFFLSDNGVWLTSHVPAKFIL
jgi:putative RNA 2'-phosphotransferase